LWENGEKVGWKNSKAAAGAARAKGGTKTETKKNRDLTRTKGQKKMQEGWASRGNVVSTGASETITKSLS